MKIYFSGSILIDSLEALTRAGCVVSTLQPTTQVEQDDWVVSDIEVDVACRTIYIGDKTGQVTATLFAPDAEHASQFILANAEI